jgi:predicted trehalose synthase
VTHDGFEVDAERLAGQARQFEPLSTRVAAIHRGLADALSDGACWGTDAVGQSFSAVHAQPADDLVSRLSSLSERLGSVGTRLADTATTYGTGEQTAVDHLKAAEQ